MAARVPTIPALKVPRGRTGSGEIDYLCLSFSELEAETAAWRERLESAGLRRGDRTLVMVRQGLPLIASVFAIFALGAVPVVIDPGMGLKSFLSCVKRSRPRAMVGIPLARLISHVARDAFRSVEIRVGASSRLDARLSTAGAQGKLEIEDTGASDLAAILFTSGSTGAPKGVCYEHGMFEAQVGLIRDAYGIEPGEVDLPLLPVFSLFSPALGMTTVVPEVNPSKPATLDPAKIVQAIRQEKVTNCFGSPTLWRIIGDHCLQEGIPLPSLRRVLCAGAPVPARLWSDSFQFLPNGLMHSPYGATEALPVSSVSASSIHLASKQGAHVGRPVAQVKIIAISDNALPDLSATRELPQGEIGEIIVSGPTVTKSYDQLPEATAKAKIADGTALWHRMGDVGFLDEKGELWFCGRKSERVETEAGTLFTEPCERVFREHPRARRCALVGLGQPGRQRAALVVETKVAKSQEARELTRVLRNLALQHASTESISVFYFREQFPVDVRHNAKIHRNELTKWALSAKGFRSDPKK